MIRYNSNTKICWIAQLNHPNLNSFDNWINLYNSIYKNNNFLNDIELDDYFWKNELRYKKLDFGKAIK